MDITKSGSECFISSYLSSTLQCMGKLKGPTGFYSTKSQEVASYVDSKLVNFKGLI